MLKKEAIRKVQPSKGEFVSNLFLVKKKDGGQRPVINLKQLIAYIPYCDFKMEGLQNLKYMLQKGDYMCKTRFKRCVLFSSLGKKFKAICLLSLVRKLVRVPLPLLWFETSSTNIHKIVKSAKDNLTQDKHQNNNLLRPHAIDWLFFRRDSHELRHSNLLSATSRICHKLEKVYVDTSAGNRVFGHDNQLCHSKTFFKQNKNSESSFRMPEFVKQSTNTNSGVDKVDWLVDVNYSSSFTSKVELSFTTMKNTTMKYHLYRRTFLI